MAPYILHPLIETRDRGILPRRLQKHARVAYGTLRVLQSFGPFPLNSPWILALIFASLGEEALFIQIRRDLTGTPDRIEILLGRDLSKESHNRRCSGSNSSNAIGAIGIR
jgi:hypothetical protein